ncbi:hypothetical protein B566_EDAN017513 [Ephemera danica]|nr:hypothetical protein B566_EDAN017513 [Ephemera danica]
MLSYVLTLGLLALTANAGSLRIPPQHYIVGGVQASPGEYPSQLSLQYNGVHRCGASIISENYALTTAYCVCVEECLIAEESPKPPPTNFKTIFQLVSGTNDLQSTDKKIHNIAEITIRDGYIGEENSWLNNIAVIKVERSGNFDPSLLIALHAGDPETGIEEPGKPVKIVGWGYETEDGTMSDLLLEADLTVVDFKTCHDRYFVEFGATAVVDQHICAAALDGKRGSCDGDYGGPLLYIDEAGPVVVGLMSWGLGCARPGYPAVYARTSRHCGWIKTNTNNEVSCTATQL